ncbi:MAG: alpha/beta hydrolase [Roseivirga sp.]|nr:alpha/beta hydrolase [Roseivirga sp.]
MKRILLLLFTGVICAAALQAQPRTPQDFGLRPYQLKDTPLGTIDFFVTQHKIDEAKPLLIFLDGSGHLPLFSLLKKTDGSTQLSSKITIDYDKLARQFHVVMISKPGTPFLDSLEANSSREFRKKYPPSAEYTQRLSLDWRVESASMVIDYLLLNLNIKNSEVVVMGYSEGGQVAPKLASINSMVTKLVNIVGGGLNQFYDMITEQRGKAQLGEISSEEAQTNIDSLMAVFKDIYAHPTSTDKMWWGHTYKRWASFCQDVPMDNMLGLDIPLLMISGGKDENAPIAGLDYVALEFLRQGKTNLTYKVYPNCNHWFDDEITGEYKLDEMLDFVTKWIEE